MRTVSPSSLVNASTPTMDEVEIWRRLDSMSDAKRNEVIERIRTCDDPVVSERARKLLRACYVV